MRRLVLNILFDFQKHFIRPIAGEAQSMYTIDNPYSHKRFINVQVKLFSYECLSSFNKFA